MSAKERRHRIAVLAQQLQQNRQRLAENAAGLQERTARRRKAV
ncbi:hypothetical protein ACFFMN_40295 [Planobispora siamensis]|nr:hypothetical protein [Planobispora siamensis]